MLYDPLCQHLQSRALGLKSHMRISAFMLFSDNCLAALLTVVYFSSTPSACARPPTALAQTNFSPFPGVGLFNFWCWKVSCNLKKLGVFLWRLRKCTAQPTKSKDKPSTAFGELKDLWWQLFSGESYLGPMGYWGPWLMGASGLSFFLIITLSSPQPLTWISIFYIC